MLLFRQVHPAWAKPGRPLSVEAFNPSTAQNRKASVDNGNSVSARDAYQHHRSAGLSTQGAVAVTVGEANRVNLSVVAQPVWNWPHRAVLDFNALPSKAARRKAARFLTEAAMRRPLPI